MNPETRPMTLPLRWPVLKLLFATLAAGALAAGALVSAAPAAAAETRSLPSFEAISVSAPIDVIVRQTGREAAQLSGEPAVLPSIETVVEARPDGPTLHIRVKPGQRLPYNTRLQVDVEVARLTAISLLGSGDVSVEPLNTPTLKLSLRGSGDARLRGLSTGQLDIGIVGSGDVRADGSAGRVALSIAGSGDALLGELAADSVSVSIAGSGDARVRARESVTVSIAGSGDVEVLGNPPSVKQSVAGSGEVTVRR